MTSTDDATRSGEPAPGDQDDASSVPLRRWGRRVGTVVGVVAALAIGQVITTALPSDEAIVAPFVREGSIGDAVPARYGVVEVGGPTGGREIDDGLRILQTPGVWVVVPVTVTARSQPTLLRHAAIVGGNGHVYIAGLRSTWGAATAQPGIPLDLHVPIELPADAAVGARLQVAEEGLDHRRDDLVEVDLGITTEDVDRWLANETPLSLPDPTELEP